MFDFLKKYGYTILLSLAILLGILLRLKGLLMNPSMWHDECALGWNIKFKKYSDFFGILRFMQMAPPFFMITTKLITKTFGFSDISLRILPFLAGVASIIAFYFLAAKILNNKSVILWAVFLFAINQQLINYSFEFKPYSFDVFFTIILLLFFINLDINKLNIKKAALYGILLSIITWFSFTSVFIIAGGCIYMLFKILKNKDKNRLFSFVLLLFPLIISSLIYLKIYLINNYTGTHMVNYWQNSFLNTNPLFFFALFIKNIKFFFFPMPFVLFPLILLVWGIITFYKEKSFFVSIFILSFVLLMAASFLHFYPFDGRLVLFLTPMILLLVIKPLDVISLDKKIKSFIILFLTFFAFYPQIICANSYICSKNLSKGEFPHEMMQFMMKKIKKNDIIFVNNASNVEFAYYSSFYNIENRWIQERGTNKSKEKYFILLNTLPKGYYWFYLPYDYSHTLEIPIIVSWAKTKQILYKYQNNRSVLIYVYIK